MTAMRRGALSRASRGACAAAASGAPEVACGSAWFACVLLLAAVPLALEPALDARPSTMFAPIVAPRRVEVPAHRIDIDRADVAELALLPEIGPGLAARIAADRAVRGGFGSIDALARVEGIGPSRIGALRGVATASGHADARSADDGARP